MPIPELKGPRPVETTLPTETSGPVELLKPADFDAKVLQSRGPVIVEFMNFGCQYCRAAKPHVDRLATELGSNTKVYMVSIANREGQLLASKYGTRAIPHFVAFNDGQELGRAARPGQSADTRIDYAAFKQLIIKPFGGNG